MNQTQIQNSALWAAFGDALGFITEFARPEHIERSFGSRYLKTPVAWKRRVGGRFGVEIELPAGSYSDDTQLRLATSRAIRGDGRFDIDAFSKIELPVWLSYALGAGRGTKSAAAALSRPSSTWSTNFFKDYVQGGGNGAAMRIQPHVWSARSDDISAWLGDVLRNTLSTHGHPRAILGAAFHAAVLSYALKSGNIASPDIALNIISALERAVPDAVRADRDISDYWLGRWESETRSSFPSAIAEVAQELRSYIEALNGLAEGKPRVLYQRYIEVLDGSDRKTVGSGTKTAALAYAVVWLYRDEPQQSVLAAANAYGTDTDTIATMAGAIAGALCESAPSAAGLRDMEYITIEASRCAEIANGGPATSSFRYPDLLTWRAPENASAALGSDGQTLQVAGLGTAYAVGDPIGREKPESYWRWVQTQFGQHLLMKTRKQPGELAEHYLPAALRTPPIAPVPKTLFPVRGEAIQLDAFAPMGESKNGGAPASPARYQTLDEITKAVIEGGFAPGDIGRELLALIDTATSEGDCLVMAAAFAAIIGKARLARQKRETPR